MNELLTTIANLIESYGGIIIAMYIIGSILAVVGAITIFAVALRGIKRNSRKW